MTIQLRRDTASNWTTANPTLAAGQPGYETDTKKLKIGDGSTAWTALAYFGGGTAWGAITGTLSSQTDLNTALGGKQPLAAVLTATTASYTTTLDAKLAGIAAGATANQTDAYLLSRANHTGTQAWSTITSTPTTLAGYGITDGITSAAVAVGYQPLDTDLSVIGALTPSNDDFLQRKSGAWANRTIAQVTSDLNATIAPTWTNVSGKPTFATVATTGAYSDLIGEPIFGSGTLTTANQLEVEQVITATGVTPSNRIAISLQAGADTDENTADMLDLITIAGIPGTNQITVQASFSLSTSGPVLINWSAF